MVVLVCIKASIDSPHLLQQLQRSLLALEPHSILPTGVSVRHPAHSVSTGTGSANRGQPVSLLRRSAEHTFDSCLSVSSRHMPLLSWLCDRAQY